MLLTNQPDMNPPDLDYRCEVCLDWAEDGIDHEDGWMCKPCAKADADEIQDSMFICECDGVFDKDTEGVEINGEYHCHDCGEKLDEMEQRG